MITQQTWGGFWGEFILVEQHKSNPNRWTGRERRAAWIVDRLDLPPGAAILGLGCGDGLLEICLGRLGRRVTGIDRLEGVMELARQEVKKEEVQFHVADLRRLQCPPDSYDAVMILDTLGLMSRKDDTDLISRAATWLRPGGKLLADCPQEPDEQHSENTWAVPVPGGQLTLTSLYEPTSRMQRITPRFVRDDGNTIELMDPYDPGRGPVGGVLRYLYPVSELRRMLNEPGLVAEEIDHFSSPKHYCVVGRKEKDA